MPTWVVVCAAALPVLLLVGWLTADAVQPASYSPARQTVSVMAGHGGHDRWIMTTALALMGCCYVALAAGLTVLRRVARIGLLVAGSCAIAIAMSPQPAVGTTRQHAVWTAIGALTITIWPALVAAPSTPRWVTGVRASAAATAVFLALLVWLALETRGGTTLGVAERVVTTVQVCWPLVVVVAMTRSGPIARRDRPGC